MAPAELPSGVEIAVAFVVMAVGAFVQGAVGFGSALIAAPVLVLLDPKTVPGPVLAASFVLAALVLHRDATALSIRRVGWALLGRVPGLCIGLFALVALSERALRGTFGALVLAAVAISSAGPRFSVRPTTLFGAGVVSGFMGTVSSIGGPPMALLLQDEPGKNLRADLSAYFLVGTALSLAGVAAVGRFGQREALWSLALVPAVVLGSALSRKGAAFVDGGHSRRAVLAVSAASALFVIAREFFG
jgi:uncharacterized membrane protein YfcA